MIYLYTQTRPSIAFAVQKLGRFNLSTTKEAEGALEKELGYLQSSNPITYSDGNGHLLKIHDRRHP